LRDSALRPIAVPSDGIMLSRPIARQLYLEVGDNVTFMFAGTVSSDTMSGSIYLGEYITAKFTAKRSSYKRERRKVVIPGGPPLAT
jgi:hypothetical protein